MHKPDKRRIRMRARRACKAWNTFMEEFDQMISEGWNTKEAQDEIRRLRARTKTLGTLMNKVMKATKEFAKDDTEV